MHYPVASEWFNRQADDLVFCRVTQMGLLRLLPSPAIMDGDAVGRSQAWRLFDQLWSDERVLWADELLRQATFVAAWWERDRTRSDDIRSRSGALVRRRGR